MTQIVASALLAKVEGDIRRHIGEGFLAANLTRQTDIR
jgi:hypothetical protein